MSIFFSFSFVFIDFLCNCDRWHCVAVKEALTKAKPGVFFNSGFDPNFDTDLCTACETCIDRCPPEALVLGEDDLPKVDWDKCFGCGVCANLCANGAEGHALLLALLVAVGTYMGVAYKMKWKPFAPPDDDTKKKKTYYYRGNGPTDADDDTLVANKMRLM